MIAKFKRQKKRNSKEETIFQILFSIFTLILIGFLIFSNLKIKQKKEKLIEEIKSLEKDIQTLEVKNRELKAGISETEKESHWEEKAREQGYVREGENPIVVLPPNEEQIEKEEEKNIWLPQFWWEWLKSKMRD